MTEEEIRCRRLAGQHLLAPVPARTVVRDLCGVQAQFLQSAMHAVRIRSGAACDPEGLVKSWTIRGTLHVFALEDLPVFLHRGRAQSPRDCDTLGADARVDAARKRFFADLILQRIEAGENTREALREACRSAGMTDAEAESIFNAWGGTIRALCDAGLIGYAVREQKTFIRLPHFEPMEANEARLEMARRYFAHFGPATVRDAAYFFGATQSQVKTWLDRLPVRAVPCGGRTYYALEGGASEPDAAHDIPPCLLLAGFDQLMLGYQKRESLFFRPEHLRGIFNLTGIVAPTVLLNGRAVGKWKRSGRRLTVTPFEAVRAADRRRIEEEALRLFPALSGVVFTEE